MLCYVQSHTKDYLSVAKWHLSRDNEFFFFYKNSERNEVSGPAVRNYQ